MSTFEQFYDLYPRKKKPRYARQCYERALSRATHEEIIKGVENLIAAGWDDVQFVPYPSSWLNGDCWLEEHEEVQAPHTPDRSKLVAFIGKGTWREDWPNRPESIEEARRRLEALGAYGMDEFHKLKVVK